jgi:hypothetical protein
MFFNLFNVPISEKSGATFTETLFKLIIEGVK